ncbi:MAG: hemerythrin domain-containing protein [Filimonas sp.]|nr:hemerythrin domain-containing protein [Filimonas sp.]
METLRYNPFHQVHQGLRALLYHTALNIQHTDFTSDIQRTSVINEIASVLDLFESHAHTEDTMVFPLVHKHAPAIANEFEQQHVKDHELSVQLSASIHTLKEAVTPELRLSAGKALYFAFTDFVVFNLAHMKQEEMLVNAVLWTNYTDSDLHALTMQIVAQIPPEKNMRYSYWMLKGLNDTEIAAWLTIVKQTAPAPVFHGLMEVAQKAMPQQRLAQLQAELDLATV